MYSNNSGSTFSLYLKVYGFDYCVLLLLLLLIFLVTFLDYSCKFCILCSMWSLHFWLDFFFLFLDFVLNPDFLCITSGSL